jgi:hypothetical protein
VRGHDGIRAGRTGWKQLPLAAVRDGGLTGSLEHALDVSVAWVAAGRPSPSTVLEQQTEWLFYAHTFGTVALNRRVCTPSTARVPLTATGLRGGAPGPFGQDFDCVAPRRVLVRLRAVMASPPTLYQDRQFLKTRTAVKEGYLAVRTPTGKPLVFATVSESGKARLLTASSCVRD